MRFIVRAVISQRWLKGRTRGFWMLCLIISGCATISTQIDYTTLYGPSIVKNRQLSQAEYEQGLARGNVSFTEDVKPILDSRCVVCHGCYDAPCQLKLSSFEGLERGATKASVYDGARLDPQQPTRLFIDAETTEQWRGKDFFPVLNERGDTPEAELNNALLARLLALKRAHPLPGPGKLPDSFKFGLDRKLQCPSMVELTDYEAEYPFWGMPYALPGLTLEQEQTLTAWLLQGAKVPPRPPLPKRAKAAIRQWERFLNGDSLKERLVSRYIYEHLFIGHLHFKGHPANEFYRLVRSTTPPGHPIDEIATVRPYDDPGTPHFYYRLRPIVSTIVDKNHFVYELSNARMARYHKLFFEPTYAVKELPSYKPETTSNPFLVFAALPERTRFRFLLDDAQYFVAGFIKGPVCRGQIALNVIRDQFWIAFLNPDLEFIEEESDFLAANSEHLRLPAASGDDMGLLGFRQYDELAREYMKIKEQEIDKLLPKNVGPSLDFIWDGDGDNRNALLTVFRHFDSATVVKGFVGDTPLTGWVIDYPVFERIHYLLVAGFNVFGAAGHQLATRLYMDYLRMEAETDFLRFLPAEQRKGIRAEWYRGVESEIQNYFDNPLYGLGRSTEIEFSTDNPTKEFFEKIQAKLGRAAGPSDVLNQCEEAVCIRPGASSQQQRVEARLQRIARLKGAQVQALPEVAFVRVRTSGPPAVDLAYTLVRNKMLENVSFLIGESLRRDADRDTVTLVAGFLGSYPNFFFSVDEQQLPRFVEMLANAQDEASTEAFYRTFGIRRSDPRIWQYSDWFNGEYRTQKPVEAGWLDMNRYQNL